MTTCCFAGEPLPTTLNLLCWEQEKSYRALSPPTKEGNAMWDIRVQGVVVKSISQQLVAFPTSLNMWTYIQMLGTLSIPCPLIENCQRKDFNKRKAVWANSKGPIFKCPKMVLQSAESKNVDHFVVLISFKYSDIGCCSERVPILDGFLANFEIC